MPPTPSEPERQLERRLGHRFVQPLLLRQALTHRSWWHEHASGATPPAVPGDNERFEFLGDAILGLRVCERLVDAFPASDEGQLTRLRSWIVSARNLAAAAQRLNLGPHLFLSHAEVTLGGRDKQRVLANAMEAIIAAIHLDGGYPTAADFVDRHVLGTSLEHLLPGQLHEFAYKSALQEWAHAHGSPLPIYRVVETTGPEHDKLYTVEVALPGFVTTTAQGASKKEAEQRAAAAALAALGGTAG